MDRRRLVLIVESDAQASAQMKTILAGMDAEVVEAADLANLSRVAAALASGGQAPELIVVRVTLPDGSGVQALNEMAELFPAARQVLVSHFSKRLLFTMPGFAECRAEFLQAEFTDEQFRKVADRALAIRRSA